MARHDQQKNYSRNPRGDSLELLGQESRGAIHVSNIFRAKNKQGKGRISRSPPAAVPREIPRRKIPILSIDIYTARVYTYIHLLSLPFFRSLHAPSTVVIRLDANSLTEPGADYARNNSEVSREYRGLCSGISPMWRWVEGEVDWKKSNGFGKVWISRQGRDFTLFADDVVSFCVIRSNGRSAIFLTSFWTI